MNERCCERGPHSTDPRRAAQAWPQSLLHRGSRSQGRIEGCSKAGCSALCEEPSGAFNAGRQVGAGRGRGHTPRGAPGARQRAQPGRPTPRRAPGRLPRAGALPRAEDPGRASSRQACELPPSGAQGEPSLAARRRDRRRPPAPAPPRTLPGGPAGVGSERGDRPAAPPSGPSPGQPSLPPQPACGRRSLRGVERGEPSRPPIQRPGQPPGADATSQNRTSLAAFGSGTLPGPRRLHCFLPPTPSRSPSPRLSSLPDPGRAAIPLPLSGRPSSPSFRTLTSLYRTTRGPLRPSPPRWPHGLSRRPLMLPAARWPGPQCPERALMVPGDRSAFL